MPPRTVPSSVTRARALSNRRPLRSFEGYAVIHRRLVTAFFPTRFLRCRRSAALRRRARFFAEIERKRATTSWAGTDCETEALEYFGIRRLD